MIDTFDYDEIAPEWIEKVALSFVEENKYVIQKTFKIMRKIIMCMIVGKLILRITNFPNTISMKRY